MRQILVGYERDKRAAKRSGGLNKCTLEDIHAHVYISGGARPEVKPVSVGFLGADYAIDQTSPGLNALGIIVGGYTDNGQAGHGFVLFRDRQIVTFPGPATDLVSVNIFGVVSEERWDSNATGVGTGSDGIIGVIGTNREKVFDAPGDPSTRWLFPNQINNSGTITEVVNGDALSGIVHGFVRSADGQMALFDAGPLSRGACCWRGTQGFGIYDSGVVAGLYTDDNFVAHGFVRYP